MRYAINCCRINCNCPLAVAVAVDFFLVFSLAGVAASARTDRYFVWSMCTNNHYWRNGWRHRRSAPTQTDTNTQLPNALCISYEQTHFNKIYRKGSSRERCQYVALCAHKTTHNKSYCFRVANVYIIGSWIKNNTFYSSCSERCSSVPMTATIVAALWLESFLLQHEHCFSVIQ